MRHATARCKVVCFGLRWIGFIMTGLREMHHVTAHRKTACLRLPWLCLIPDSLATDTLRDCLPQDYSFGCTLAAFRQFGDRCATWLLVARLSVMDHGGLTLIWHLCVGWSMWPCVWVRLIRLLRTVFREMRYVTAIHKTVCFGLYLSSFTQPVLREMQRVAALRKAVCFVLRWLSFILAGLRELRHAIAPRTTVYVRICSSRLIRTVYNTICFRRHQIGSNQTVLRDMRHVTALRKTVCFGLRWTCFIVTSRGTRYVTARRKAAYVRIRLTLLNRTVSREMSNVISDSIVRDASGDCSSQGCLCKKTFNPFTSYGLARDALRGCSS